HKRFKAQNCRFPGWSGKDAVPSTQMCIQSFGLDFVRHLFGLRYRFDGIHREASQTLPEMAPRVQIPVASVIDQPLRRDLPFETFVSIPGIVPDHETAAVDESP